MNCECLGSSIGPDRLATREEVRCALSLASPVGPPRPFSEMESGAGRCVSNLREEMEWVTIIRKMRNCMGN
jgi:hypothetical protein